MSGGAAAPLLVLALALSACGAETPVVATQTGTFYQFDDGSMGFGSGRFERPFPPLDRAPEKDRVGYVGVEIFGGKVRFSRPKNWVIRRASLVPERRYVEYVSPEQYLFAVYERTDSPDDPWRDVIARYERDAKDVGAELLGARMPVAGYVAQGRSFIVRRKVRGAKGPYFSTSRETIVRSDHRLVLASLVHQGDVPTLVVPEIVRVYETFEVF